MYFVDFFGGKSYIQRWSMLEQIPFDTSITVDN